MAGKTISKFRLLLNGAGCTVIAVFCVPLGLLSVWDLATGNTARTNQPEAAQIVLALGLFAGVLGAIALVSLVRTVRAWRRLRQE